MEWEQVCSSLFDGWLVPTLDGTGFETTRYLDPEDPLKTRKDPDQERSLRLTIESQIERLKPLGTMLKDVIQSCFDCGADNVRAEVDYLIFCRDSGTLRPVYRLQACYGCLYFYIYLDERGAYSVLPD